VSARQYFELLARLPARVWLQAAVGLIGFIVLAVLGFAVIAGVVAFIVLAILGYKAKAWIAGLFGATAPPARTRGKVIDDVHYEIVERNDNEGR